MYIKKFNTMLSILFISLFFTQYSAAKPASEIEKDVDNAILKFEKDIQEYKTLISEILES